MMRDVQIEALRQEFFRKRDRVWADTRMPLDQKQAEVNAL